MRKTLIWTVVGLLVLLALFVLNAFVVPSLLRRNSEATQVTQVDLGPLTVDSLEVMPVDLGPLSPGETREFKVIVRNTSLRPISLLPKSDCGCIYHDAKMPLSVPRQGSIELPFSFRAPAWPGHIRKKITFAAKDSASLGWEVPVTAHVVAKAWAVPPSLQLSYDRVSVLEPSIALYHDEQTRIGAVVSTSPAITVETEHRGGNRVQVDLKICPPPMKGGETWEGTLQVFEQDGNAELLTIPVRISSRPELQCVPGQVALNGQQETGDRFEKTVLVRSDADSAIDAKPLFPWIHVERLERRSRGFKVRLSFDKGAVPVNFHENIVEFGLQGKRPTAFLVGVSGD
jgi:hypothetical protein